MGSDGSMDVSRWMLLIFMFALWRHGARMRNVGQQAMSDSARPQMAPMQHARVKVMTQSKRSVV